MWESLVRLPLRVLIECARACHWALSRVLIALVRIYQWTLSPIFGRQCRFQPTCSHYMIGAIEKYGAIRGVGKGLWRILRCNPLCKGGYDPP